MNPDTSNIEARWGRGEDPAPGSFRPGPVKRKAWLRRIIVTFLVLLSALILIGFTFPVFNSF